METYTATVVWQRDGESFIDNRYSRVHRWEFDGGARILASPSPLIVPTPMSDPALIDPEEAFVAAISSCHMLFFLSLAARHKLNIDRYSDNAVGTMEKNRAGKTAITKVVLHPQISEFGELQTSRKDLTDLHHQAHDLCFIANSVTTKIEFDLG